MDKVDARGLSCPQPVILTQKKIDSGIKNFEITVSSVVSQENVIRCAHKNKLNTEIREDGDEYIVKISE